jgi:broad specificity phosphatase PhoE
MPPVEPVTTQIWPDSPRSTGRYVSRVTTILLARHGETDWNRDGRWQGWSDPPLNETGRAQARLLAEQLSSTPFDAVYASDLRRAFETAEIVGATHGLDVVADAGLREIDIGSWSGLTKPEIEERFPDGGRPDGETHEQHAERVVAAVERIAREHPDERILIVTHGGTMHRLIDAAGADNVTRLENCAVLELHFREDRLAAPME